MEFKAHKYQERAIEFVTEQPYCALFVDMGLGKTSVALTALRALQRDYLDVGKILVIAPKSVALNTWTAECSKWDHLQDTRVSLVMGPVWKRKDALEADADVYVTNRDNTVWLVSQYVDMERRRLKREWPFDCVVLDESTSFKNFQSKRFKALALVRPYIRRLVELTGTPAPNGLMDLWPQVKLLDGGERLGATITQYREAYFRPGAHNGAVVYEYVPRKGARERISEKVSDICMSLKAEDYLDMPECIDGGMTLQLDEMFGYRGLEMECVAQLEDGAQILAVTAAALANKLLQYSSGALYDDEHNWHEVSSTKMDALLDLLEQTSEPVLVYYNYRHELARIQREVPDAVSFHGEPDILDAWNRGEIRVLCAHPASVAFGLNMQAGGHIIVWYSPTWNLELYQQANARLLRQGQTKPVIIYHLVCKDTMDETVMAALQNKEGLQDAMMRIIKKLRNEPTLGLKG
jgi:SNF2 family DNA or RNA helicase